MAEEKREPPRNIVPDPYPAFRFTVVIGNRVVAGFSEVTGLTFETEVQTFREGGVNTHEKQLTGPTKYPSKLILKRGLADADALWAWYLDVMKHRIRRKNVTIILANYAYEGKWQWTFRNACPVKWTGPEFHANTAAVAFESVELIHQGLRPNADNGRYDRELE